LLAFGFFAPAIYVFDTAAGFILWRFSNAKCCIIVIDRSYYYLFNKLIVWYIGRYCRKRWCTHYACVVI